jgi:hypothetical protein
VQAHAGVVDTGWGSASGSMGRSDTWTSSTGASAFRTMAGSAASPSISSTRACPERASTRLPRTRAAQGHGIPGA